MKGYEITLVTQYKDGKEVKEHTVDIMGKLESVTRSEFYASYGVGLNPKYIFSVWNYDFSLGDIEIDGITYHPTHVRYNGELLEIIRTFSKTQSELKITVG